jgi:hypothetical protein
MLQRDKTDYVDKKRKKKYAELSIFYQGDCTVNWMEKTEMWSELLAKWARDWTEQKKSSDPNIWRSRVTADRVYYCSGNTLIWRENGNASRVKQSILWSWMIAWNTKWNLWGLSNCQCLMHMTWWGKKGTGDFIIYCIYLS